MTWIWILLAVLAVLLTLLILSVIAGKASLRITLQKRLRVVLYVLGVPITLVSDKTKKQELKPCKNPRRALRRELKAAQKAEKQAAKKRENARLRALKKQKKKQSNAPSPNLFENISMITALVKKAYKLTRGKPEIHVRKMRLSVATEDAATTAYLYAGVLEAMTFLCQWIESKFTHIRRNEGAMQVTADFGAVKTTAEIDISFKIHFSHALSIAHGMRKAYRQEKKAAISKARARVAAKQERESA